MAAKTSFRPFIVANIGLVDPNSAIAQAGPCMRVLVRLSTNFGLIARFNFSVK
jgi:hypothetical protein